MADRAIECVPRLARRLSRELRSLRAALERAEDTVVELAERPISEAQALALVVGDGVRQAERAITDELQDMQRSLALLRGMIYAAALDSGLSISGLARLVGTRRQTLAPLVSRARRIVPDC